jgi:hypothetical protein
MRRTTHLLLVVTLLALPFSSQAADSSPVELTVLNAPKDVPAFSSFYVRVRLVNTGSRPLRGCLIELSRLVSTEPCAFLGYRFWKAPTRFKVDSVDPLPFLQHSDILGPGEQLERSVRLVSPRQSRTGTLHLYAVSGSSPDALTWVHQSVPITVGPAPFEVRRREIVALALVGVYVLGVAWALFRLALGLSRAWRRPCSS